MIFSVSTQRRTVNFSVDWMNKEAMPHIIRHGWIEVEDHWIVHTSIWRLIFSLSSYKHTGSWR